MRKKNQTQMPLMPSNIEHPRARELDRISQILEAIPIITDMVLQDLTHGVNLSPDGHPKSPTCGHFKIPHPARLIFQ